MCNKIGGALTQSKVSMPELGGGGRTGYLNWVLELGKAKKTSWFSLAFHQF